mmetsp:Transcript_712/g.1285  ORF Transcript_712/g.1285 Transcript_712/m.1285 type:complete len:216 (+) Transcript_712:193-840(+)
MVVSCVLLAKPSCNWKREKGRSHESHRLRDFCQRQGQTRKGASAHKRQTTNLTSLTSLTSLCHAKHRRLAFGRFLCRGQTCDSAVHAWHHATSSGFGCWQKAWLSRCGLGPQLVWMQARCVLLQLRFARGWPTRSSFPSLPVAQRRYFQLLMDRFSSKVKVSRSHCQRTTVCKSLDRASPQRALPLSSGSTWRPRLYQHFNKFQISARSVLRRGG